MTKQQKLGTFRAVLTALGASLATWGISDGNQWAPVTGAILAVISATWGVLHHRDPATPSTIRWSLVRKAASAIGAALVTYGFLNPERVAGLEMLIASFGPLLALWFSKIDNSPGDDDDDDGFGEPDPPRRGDVGLWLIFLALTSFLLMPGCTVTVAPDGSVSATVDDAPAAVRVVEILTEK